MWYNVNTLTGVYTRLFLAIQFIFIGNETYQLFANQTTENCNKRKLSGNIPGQYHPWGARGGGDSNNWTPSTLKIISSTNAYCIHFQFFPNCCNYYVDKLLGHKPYYSLMLGLYECGPRSINFTVHLSFGKMPYLSSLWSSLFDTPKCEHLTLRSEMTSARTRMVRHVTPL